MKGYSREESDKGVTSTAVDEDHLARMQFEALNSARILELKATDFKENRRSYVPSAHITRRLDEAGTEEYHLVQGEGRQLLGAWNRAWTALQDDGTATDDFTNVNEGLGQTHRGKLQADDSVRDYTGDEFDHRGNYGGARGVHYGSRGGRGGGFVGHGQVGGRQATIQRPPPIKRARVLKSASSHLSSALTSTQVKASPGRQIAIPAAPSRPQSLLEQVPRVKPASTTKFSQQISTRRSEEIVPKASKKPTDFHGSLATPNDFMASILQKTGPVSVTPTIGKPEVESTIGSTSVAPQHESQIPQLSAVAPTITTTAVTNGSDISKSKIGDNNFSKAITVQDRPPISKAKTEGMTHKTVDLGLNNDMTPAVLPPAHTDLLDGDITGEGPHQRVIGFTHATESDAEADISAHIPKSSELLKNIEALQAIGGLSTKELELLQTLKTQVEARASEPISEVSTTTHQHDSEPVHLVTSPPVPQAIDTPLLKTDAQESLARRIVAQRATIIGEHVHRTRFHHSALIEEFQKLKTPGNTASTTAKAEVDDGLSTTNPFGPAKPPLGQQSGRGPSLPAHLAHLSPVADSGAAVRVQYDSSKASNGDREASNARTGPSLPAHLTHLSPVADPGAAVRAQYDSSKASNGDREPAKGRTGPSLPVHLAHLSPVADPGAAVRAQYDSSKASNGDREASNARTGPSLPAHLAPLLPVTATGVATHDQYNSDIKSRGRGVLNTVSNGQLRDTATSATSTSSASALRTSMLNKTGFVGLADNRAEANRSDDPLLVARKRGM